MITLIHRHEPLAYQVKTSASRHRFIRQIRDHSGATITRWKRTTVKAIAELQSECIVSEVLQ